MAQGRWSTPVVTLLVPALASLALGGGPARGQVCINEVLYDPAGPDAGAEFVELYNSSSQIVSLSGWRLEAGNGAAPGDWRVQWQGEAGQAVRPGAFFLVAGESVAGAADARAALSLQNGPDAVRLVGPAGLADLLGWGTHAYAEFYEGVAAPDAPSGWSLARVPDGQDSGSNAADFMARPWPSPGRPNAAAGLLELSDLRCDPPVLDEDTPALVEATVRNPGLEPIALEGLTWGLDCGGLSIAEAAPPTGRLQPASEAVCRWTLEAPGDLPAGVVRLVARAVGNGSEIGPLEVPLRIGRGAVAISEIQYDPAPGEGEWVELCNLSAEAVPIGGWSVRDASGHTTAIDPSAEALEPGGCALLAEDADGLRARWPDLAGAVILERTGAWPGLNNSLDRDLGYADEVLLAGADGIATDYVRYSPGGLDGGGVSLERWIEEGRLVEPRLLIACASAGGATPGAVRGPPGARGEWLEPHPSPFAPDAGDGARLCSVRVPAPPGGAGQLSAAIYSLAGHHVATLCAAAQVLGPSVLLWDGRDGAGQRQCTGLYLVRIELAPLAGGAVQRTVRPLLLVRG